MYIEKNTYGWNFTPFSTESAEFLESPNFEFLRFRWLSVVEATISGIVLV